MTKAQTAERQDAIAQLREWIKPGDTVYTILESVSRSGMSRVIRVVLPTISKQYRQFDSETGRCLSECECTFGRGSHGTFEEAHGPDLSVSFLHPNYSVALAIGARLKTGSRDGIVMNGCGMDMGFALVYELSQALYREYECVGESCTSPEHSNGRRWAAHTCRTCGHDRNDHHREGFHAGACEHRHQDTDVADCLHCAEFVPTPYVDKRGAGVMHHDGYALRHGWL